MNFTCNITNVKAKEHWDAIYRSKKPEEVGWYQRVPTVSLDLIRRVAPQLDAAIIDVGGGASTLVDSLPDARVTVLDISAAALAHAKSRLGSAADRVVWRCADVLSDELPVAAYDVWHDRAVFHFLTSADDRRRYVAQLSHALRPGGHVIIATFAEDGPTRCSGLDVVRYSPGQLHAELGPPFELIETLREEHITPSGTPQAFVYCLFRYGEARR